MAADVPAVWGGAFLALEEADQFRLLSTLSVTAQFVVYGARLLV